MEYQQNQAVAKEQSSWYAMRVFMNKVPLCRDLFNINNDILKGVSEPPKGFSPKMMGEPMDYYAPMITESRINSRGKKVSVTKPLIPSLFFMRSNRPQAECLEKEFTGFARLYRHIKDNKLLPVEIPLRQMQMFMMVSSGDQEGLDYFEDGAFNWQKGERVRVIDGKFKGLEGEIKRIKGDHRLVVALEGICAVATTYIPRCFLQKLD